MTPDTDSNAPAEQAAPQTSPIVVAVNVNGDRVGGGWGRARTVAIATIANARIVSWEEHAVGWDATHDQDTEGHHHADIVRFLSDQGVQAVVTGHMGPPMANTLRKLGVLAVVGAAGDPRTAALAGAAAVEEVRFQSERESDAPPTGD